jgi:membrane protein implicated in regulation of membrane protease activity
MNRNGNQSDIGAMQLLGMVAGLLIAPVATPALIWATVAANLPLALVIVQLFVMAVISNWLSRRMIRNYELTDGAGDDETMSNPWSSEPSNG